MGELTIVTWFDDQADFWTGEGWYACRGAYDLDARVGNGKTEAEAIERLIESEE